MAETAQPYGIRWFDETGTGIIPEHTSHLAAAVIDSAWMIGTGGVPTAGYFSRRNEMGYKFLNVENPPPHEVYAHRAPAKNVAHIREILKPAVSEFASLFRVSRQTIYDWQNGTQPAPEHENKLEDLSKAADVFLMEGVPVTPYLLKRNVAGGKTLFDIVREGGSAEEAARQLSEMVLHEFRQRRRLDARLAKRKLQATGYDDAGVPAFNERS